MTREAGKRPRRTHRREFKSKAAALVRTGGRSVAQVAEELDVADNLVRAWVQQAEVDAGQGQAGALTTAEKEELSQLRREVKVLRMEREILERAATFFAKMGDERSGGLRWELTTTVDETLARIERAGRTVELMFDARRGRFRLARGSAIVFESRDSHFQPRLVASSRSATILAGTVRPGAEGSIIETRTRSPLLGAWPAALLLIWPLGMLVAGAWYPLVTVGGLFFAALALFASVLLVGQRGALQRQALKSLIEVLEEVRRTTSPSLGPYR